MAWKKVGDFSLQKQDGSREVYFYDDAIAGKLHIKKEEGKSLSIVFQFHYKYYHDCITRCGNLPDVVFRSEGPVTDKTCYLSLKGEACVASIRMLVDSVNVLSSLGDYLNDIYAITGVRCVSDNSKDIIQKLRDENQSLKYELDKLKKGNEFQPSQRQNQLEEHGFIQCENGTVWDAKLFTEAADTKPATRAKLGINVQVKKTNQI